MINPEYKTEEDQFSGLDLLEVMALADDTEDVDYSVLNPEPALRVKTMSRSVLERELESMGYEPSRVTQAITRLAQKTPEVESIAPQKALKYLGIGTAAGAALGVVTDAFLYFITKGQYTVPVATVFCSSSGLAIGLASIFVDKEQKQQELTKQ
ncbi:MAG: hypothetical protein AABW48_04425 [Nanoarchaeota archaeon]